MDNMNEIDEIRWLEANKAEQTNWDICLENFEMDELREISVRRYSDIMELKRNQDLEGKKILDIGAGYTSILPTFQNFREGLVVDPSTPYPQIVDFYHSHNINYIQLTAEKYLRTNFHEKYFDEVWIYNVLKHVQNPDFIMNNLPKTAKVLRIAELTDNVTDIAHPFIIKQEWLKEKMISISTFQTFHEEHRWFEQPQYGNIQFDAFGGVCILK
jgi:2-polyprenyl-3-methyl-5-hydroxy-6-metoxy-1,4-benzoquinol methylase